MISLLYGGITHHYISTDLNYCNKINNMGSIHNEYFIALAGSKKSKLGLIKGKDSACGDIMGPISSFTLSDSFEFIVGGYNANFKDFRKRGIEPFAVGSITPIVGVDYRIKLSKSVSIDNLFSMGIITHAIRVDF